jgi:small basic protein (TIGR04137 family)
MSWRHSAVRATYSLPVGVFRLGENTFYKFMSQHRSLRAASTSGAKRNVLKRYERVEILKKRNQWKTGDRVTGLRKTKPSE